NNRSAILAILDRDLARAAREGTSLGILMADLDYFKQINDSHGHVVGDHVLYQIAHRMQAVMRPYDAIGRYGGEEFLAVLPGCDSTIALRLAERLRSAIAEEPVDLGNRQMAVTVSL